MLSFFTRCSLSLHMLGLATLCVFYVWPSFPKTKTVVEPTLLRTTVFKNLFRSLDLYIYHNTFCNVNHFSLSPAPSGNRNNQLRYLINRFVNVIVLFKILFCIHCLHPIILLFFLLNTILA